MKTTFGIAVITLTLFAGLVGRGEAITLGLPDISFDSSQGNGQDLFTVQGVHYDAATGYLAVSAAALAITFDGVNSTALTNGTVDYRVDLLSASSSGGVVTGLFGTDLVAGADLVVTDTSGVLLTGDFLTYTLNGVIGTNLGTGEAVFVVTGGSLASSYSGNNGGMVNLTFNVTPSFSSVTFAKNFDGEVKGDIAPVPEPASLLLLGSGLIGLGVWGRKKFAGAI